MDRALLIFAETASAEDLGRFPVKCFILSFNAAPARSSILADVGLSGREIGGFGVDLKLLTLIFRRI